MWLRNLKLAIWRSVQSFLRIFFVNLNVRCCLELVDGLFPLLCAVFFSQFGVAAHAFFFCSLAPLALAGVVCCCLLCSGVCCWAWLSSVVSWWLLVSCFGGAVPVWPCSSPPCGLVWCVWVLRSAVLRSVVLCCRVVVCCRALLSVCVVACACYLFPGAALSAVFVLVCFPVVGRPVVTPCSLVLCPVVLCCRVVVRCCVQVSFCGALCACRRF